MGKDSTRPNNPGGWSRDLRGWLEKLADDGDLKVVKAKVECGGEIQEIGRQMSARKGPAVLFENIDGHEDTFCKKLFIGSLNTFGKIAMTVDLPSDTPNKEIFERVRETLESPIPPVRVDDGPIKENIIKGDDVDLNTIPVPKWHPKDAGKYINMWAAIVTKDPDSGEYNIGAYRGVIQDNNHIGVFLLRTQGWGIHFSKYEKRGEPMPVACVYGWDPSLMLTAGSPVTTMNEWDWMGAIRGEPVPLIKCETVDLEVPATAEIVVEGFIPTDPNTFRPEAPLKEVSGSYAEASMMPVMEATCVTYRNDPIMVGTAIGLAPIAEEQVLTMAAGTTAVLRHALELQGVPGVLDLTLSPFFAVKIQKMFQGHAYQVAASLFGHKALNMRYKMLVVVEENVDLQNPNAIIAAMNTNVDPARDLYVFPTQRSIMDTAISKARSDSHEYGGTLSNKLLIDATCNWIDHPRQEKWNGARKPPVEAPPKEDVDKVAKRWTEYGF
jgi:UbiD family decarboxylase